MDLVLLFWLKAKIIVAWGKPAQPALPQVVSTKVIWLKAKCTAPSPRVVQIKASSLGVGVVGFASARSPSE